MDPCGTPKVNGAGEVFHIFYDKSFSKLVCIYVTHVLLSQQAWCVKALMQKLLK